MLEKIQHLETLVAEAELRLRLIPESVWSDKSSVEKWSKKEILGHLIDSAQNNLRRLIVTQNERPEKVIYDQDFWVEAQNYQNADIDEIIDLWKLLNRQLIRSFSQLPVEKYHFTIDVGRVENEYLSMTELLIMYTDHLQHHLNQVFDKN